MPTPEESCHNDCVGVLHQHSSSCSQEGPSPWGVGRLQCEVYQPLLLSRPESRSDPIGGSEPSPGRETQDWDSLPDFFF